MIFISYLIFISGTSFSVYFLASGVWFAAIVYLLERRRKRKIINMAKLVLNTELNDNFFSLGAVKSFIDKTGILFPLRPKVEFLNTVVRNVEYLSNYSYKQASILFTLHNAVNNLSLYADSFSSPMEELEIEHYTNSLDSVLEKIEEFEESQDMFKLERKYDYQDLHKTFERKIEIINKTKSSWVR